MWWIFEARDNPTMKHGPVYMAYGHWGQFIFIVPQAKMVVVFTNHNTATYAQELKPIDLFFKRVLPLVE
jgi:CubicO group peptidase (beta-lactamase class C family)